MEFWFWALYIALPILVLWLIWKWLGRPKTRYSEAISDKTKDAWAQFDLEWKNHKHRYVLDFVKKNGLLGFICQSCPQSPPDAFGRPFYHCAEYTITRYKLRDMLGTHKHQFKIEGSSGGRILFVCRTCAETLVQTQHQVYELAWFGLNSKGKGMV
jgi:hypothetical protein